jgi:mannitol/fructose-specific phosphotransferase system IIA component (Ntr-type)
VQVLRFLNTNCVKLALDTVPTPPLEEEAEAARQRRERHDKERVITELGHLLEGSGAVVNPSKLIKDLINRERKATTAILPGVAIPHVRTLQVRSFIIGFARAQGDGIPFASLDGQPTRLFIPLVSPPYDDRIYLQVYRQLALVITHEDLIEQLLRASSVQEVFNILRQVMS